MLVPTAEYSSPTGDHSFVPGDGPHTTNGKTTQISDIVVKAGGEDRDQPTEAKDTELGALRAQLTTLQDKLNEFLTQRMQRDKVQGDDIERRLLDEGYDGELSDLKRK
ncbi:EKC/KEOPS complex subunit Gon7p [[Candida] railenensis]|uniref:EKC/KEOPS complex subunit GON7 n=1 Tax=[Candida] railenensis TaxID=45579 RepID=A0A9P0QK57_9ASCO|nr:EKC/KEOPS complex subunit Gon7p [[Candida] railenensis]